MKHAVNIADGAAYAPSAKAASVVKHGEFNFAAAFLDHGHIYGQTNGLLDAGATLTRVYDPDPGKIASYCARYPQAVPDTSFEAILDDSSIQLVASAAIPCKRAGIGKRVLEAGKDYFTDKSPFTDLAQLGETKSVVERTGRRFFVYYAERIHNEAAWHAGELISDGTIGQVHQVVTLAPHRLSKDTRPSWFFEKASVGGIITDLGSHQVEQFLTYASCQDATVNFARVRNAANPDKPELEDIGELSLLGDNGSTFYARLDWETPAGMPVWGDGRTFVLGDRGTIEVRKYVDLGRAAPASGIFLADQDSVKEIDCLGKVGFPFFGKMILDVLGRTELSMSQAHIFKSAEISMRAQALADSQRLSGARYAGEK